MSITPIFTDSLSAVTLFNRGNLSKQRTGKRMYNNLKKLLINGDIILVEIPGKYNCANSMTKLTTGDNLYGDKERIENGYNKSIIETWMQNSLFANK